METVGQLTGGLAHDFNNLLAGISGSLELMATRITQGRLADVDRYMVAAQGKARRAAALTHRPLAFSRRQTLAPKVTDMNALVTGMTANVIARAFDPFFTTKPIGLGTGLGLSMVYGFARQSGGQVRIYSEVGEGTMVCLYLPRHLGSEDDREVALEVEAAVPTGVGERVLVIDDEPAVRMLIVDVLEELGYAALEAGDGPEGLKVHQSRAQADLLVTDVGLPGGLNGRQVADAARSLRPDLKVLFITGYAENAVIGHGHLDPGMHVVTKPFAVEDLARRIRAILSES